MKSNQSLESLQERGLRVVRENALPESSQACGPAVVPVVCLVCRDMCGGPSNLFHKVTPEFRTLEELARYCEGHAEEIIDTALAA